MFDCGAATNASKYNFAKSQKISLKLIEAFHNKNKSHENF